MSSTKAQTVARSAHHGGFSLVEILVAVAVFSVVMVIAVGSLLAIIDANRRAQALGSVMTNLNFALESMVRNARTGTTFHCGSGNIATPSDCQNGGAVFAFEPFDGDDSTPSDQHVYRLQNSRLERSTDGGATFIPVTAAEVQIEELTFYVTGAADTDNLQPKLVVTIRGTAGISDNVQTDFSLQAVASQREFDI